jgi:biopolymer transport protein ExbB
MIQTFKLMTLFGAGDANAVSGGISESLVTTELGLIVAIPSLVAHAIMSRRCQHYMAGLESYAVKVSHSVQVTAPDTKENSSVVHEVSNVA